MKKTLFVLVAAVLTSMFASAQITDTIVSLTPSNRNVLLEEYTGINCGYCPDGHRIANEIMAANPGRVCVINIHQGTYAANTYTTQFGNALANQTGLNGYPAGTVNRHVFSGSATYLDRGQWTAAANNIMNMASPVNIAAEGTLDWDTRTLNVRVQLYYTASQSVSSNALNVAIIQDNVLGQQSGMSYNPNQVVGNQYNHMHMLRHLVTGQWGETINTITPGTLVEKNYEYVIPAQLGSPNAINAVLQNLNFIAFVCEGHQEVLTSIEIPIQHLNINLTGYDARILNITEVKNTECNNKTNAFFEFKNISSETLTSLTYTYTIGGVSHSVDLNDCSIAPLATSIIELPELEVQPGTNNTLKIQITKMNNQDVTTTAKSLTIKKNVFSAGGNMTFKLVTDRYASETTFKFFDPDGNVVLSGGPWSNLSSNGTTVREFEFNPSTTGCYRLEVYDSYGDGLNSGAGAGYFQLLDAEGSQIFRDNGKFGSQATYMIDVLYPAGIEEYTTGSVIYPNPATDVINIRTSDNVERIELYNMQGQLVKMEMNVENISVRDLTNGVYMLKLTTDKGTSMHKIVKK